MQMREPDYWRKLKRYKGFPVPYIVPYDGDRPVFSRKNPAAVLRCAVQRLCGICGQKIVGPMAFVGGRLTTTLQGFHEPPFHELCARASLKLCPYLISTDDEIFLTLANRVAPNRIGVSVNCQVSAVIRTEQLR